MSIGKTKPRGVAVVGGWLILLLGDLGRNLHGNGKRGIVDGHGVFVHKNPSFSWLFDFSCPFVNIIRAGVNVTAPTGKYLAAGITSEMRQAKCHRWISRASIHVEVFGIRPQKPSLNDQGVCLICV